MLPLFLNKKIYQTAAQTINIICRQNGVDNSHGLAHALQIAIHVKNSLDSIKDKQILSEQQEEAVLMAALLHDIDDRKYFRSSVDLSNAKKILREIQFNQINTQNVIRMIELVSFSKNGNKIYERDPTYFYIPRYADRIQAVGLIGLYRCYEYSKNVKNPFFTEKTAKPSSFQEFEQIIKGRDIQYMERGGTSESVIDHMFDKILHIRLPQQFNNPYLERMYKEGRQYIMDFILMHSSQNYKNAQTDLLDRVHKWQTSQKKGNSLSQQLI